MKRVIHKPMNTAVVVVNETKEFKLYALDTGTSLYILNAIPDLDPRTVKFQWLSILRPKLHIGRPTKFYDAIKMGVNNGDVFELDNISDLLEFLKDREEDYLDQV